MLAKDSGHGVLQTQCKGNIALIWYVKAKTSKLTQTQKQTQFLLELNKE